MRRSVTLLLLLFLLSSHELFLKSDSYFLEENEASELFLFSGTFDQSENVITRDRIINARILGPEYEFLPEAKDYYDQEAATYLKFKAGKEGTYIAGISTKPRKIELSAADFEAYLMHEGLTDMIQDRRNKGISENPAVEKYSKHVKAVFQVGSNKTDHYSIELVYPIELIPLKNPYTLQVNDEMSFKLHYMGDPLSNQIVHIGHRKGPEDKDDEEDSTTTDDTGEFSFRITETGQWYVATIFMFESEEESFDYESNWATLTFEVK